MSSQHTRGPWTALPHLDSPLGNIKSAAFVAATDWKIVVATCDTAGARNAEEENSNARLIAAAPDLLDAAVDALWLFDQPASEDLQSDAIKIVRELKAAIEKATGAKP